MSPLTKNLFVYYAILSKNKKEYCYGEVLTGDDTDKTCDGTEDCTINCGSESLGVKHTYKVKVTKLPNVTEISLPLTWFFAVTGNTAILKLPH